jgi:PleD family two-component response regulator
MAHQGLIIIGAAGMQTWRTDKKILLILDEAVQAKVVSEALHGSFRVEWLSFKHAA